MGFDEGQTLMKRLKGIPASPGIAVAPVFLLVTKAIQISRRPIQGAEQEIKRLHQAINSVSSQIAQVQARTTQLAGHEEAAIFGAHLMMLEDPALVETASNLIRQQAVCAEWALQSAGEEVAQVLAALEDPYMAERAADVRDVVGQVVRVLTGEVTSTLEELSIPSIIVAKDLTPSQTAGLNPKLVMGFTTEEGGATSHTVILARAMRIPAVVGVPKVTTQVSTGELVVLDGSLGQLTLRPDPAELALAAHKSATLQTQTERRNQLISLPALTADGARVELSANISTPAEATAALSWGADGIGLFRTEFLYMNRDQLPTEAEHYAAYRQVLLAMGPDRPVIIRTLDIGGDKPVLALNLPYETNPFLGLRALRICLQNPDLFKIQLRALLRASVHGRLRIMYPMVQSVQEVLTANQLLKTARQELLDQGEPVGAYEVGIMIEIPAAVTIADLLAQHVDFFSLGTNDLIQYTLAVDRMNTGVAHLYQPFHPAILRLIGQTCDAVHRASKWVGICGELGADPVAVPVLLGLGVKEFSMSAPSLPAAKEAVRAINRSDAQVLAFELLQLSDPVAIRRRAEAFYHERLSI